MTNFTNLIIQKNVQKFNELIFPIQSLIIHVIRLFFFIEIINGLYIILQILPHELRYDSYEACIFGRQKFHVQGQKDYSYGKKVASRVCDNLKSILSP